MSKTHQLQSGMPNRVLPNASQATDASTSSSDAHCVQPTRAHSGSTAAADTGENKLTTTALAVNSCATADVATDANKQPNGAIEANSTAEVVQTASIPPVADITNMQSTAAMHGGSLMPESVQAANASTASDTVNSIQNMTQADILALTEIFSSLRMKGVAPELCKLVDDFCMQNGIRPRAVLGLFSDLREVKRNFTVQNIISRSGIPTTLLGSTFDKEKARCGEIDELLSLKWLDQYKSLFLSGAPGLGKTLVAVNIARRAAEIRGYSVFFADSTNLLHELRHGHHERIMDRVSNAKLLVLDDVGTEELFDGNTLLLYRVLKNRMNENLYTIITASVSVMQWSRRFDDPERFSGIVNRLLSQTKKIKFNGESFYIGQTLKLNQN